MGHRVKNCVVGVALVVGEAQPPAISARQAVPQGKVRPVPKSFSLFFLVNVPRIKHLWRNAPSVLLYETPIGGKKREGISRQWRVSPPCQKGEREVGGARRS